MMNLIRITVCITLIVSLADCAALNRDKIAFDDNQDLDTPATAVISNDASSKVIPEALQNSENINILLTNDDLESVADLDRKTPLPKINATITEENLTNSKDEEEEEEKQLDEKINDLSKILVSKILDGLLHSNNSQITIGSPSLAENEDEVADDNGDKEKEEIETISETIKRKLVIDESPDESDKSSEAEDEETDETFASSRSIEDEDEDENGDEDQEEDPVEDQEEDSEEDPEEEQEDDQDENQENDQEEDEILVITDDSSIKTVQNVDAEELVRSKREILQFDGSSLDAITSAGKNNADEDLHFAEEVEETQDEEETEYFDLPKENLEIVSASETISEIADDEKVKATETIIPSIRNLRSVAEKPRDKTAPTTYENSTEDGLDLDGNLPEDDEVEDDVEYKKGEDQEKDDENNENKSEEGDEKVADKGDETQSAGLVTFQYGESVEEDEVEEW